MYSFFLIFLLLLARVQCENGRQRKSEVKFENKFVASIKEYPSLLHKCTATFIRSDVLLTTAKCLYCEDECKLFVYTFSDHLMAYDSIENGALINISRTITHPDYERNPQRNDVGLIKLSDALIDATVLSLPTKIYEKSGIAVTSYSWQFTNNFKDYVLKKQQEHTVSQALCSLAFNRYIDYKHICSRREEPAKMGPFDQGSPLITEENHQKVILGFYTSESTHRSKFEVYQSVFPYAEWIRKMLSCDFNCSAASSGGNKTPEERTSSSTTHLPLPQSTLTSSTILNYEEERSTGFPDYNLPSLNDVSMMGTNGLEENNRKETKNGQNNIREVNVRPTKRIENYALSTHKKRS